MRFARLGAVGREIPALVDGDRFFDLRPLISDVTGDFLADDPVARVAAARDAGRLPQIEDAGALRIGAPIARPSAVVCIGMNYAAHAAESGSSAPEAPIMFLKAPNTVVGPFDTLTTPRHSVRTDWEVELGIVIGRRAAYLDGPEQASEHIAGFVLVDDVSEREFQLEASGGQWSKGKCAPGFTPTGPWLVTPDEFDHNAARLRSSVNGEPRQDSTTTDMVFSVEHLLWHLSQYLTLEPGDLVLTGTPQGVALSGRFPYLAPGDVVEVEIDGLGRQRRTCRAWEQAG